MTGLLSHLDTHGEAGGLQLTYIPSLPSSWPRLPHRSFPATALAHADCSHLRRKQARGTFKSEHVRAIHWNSVITQYCSVPTCKMHSLTFHLKLVDFKLASGGGWLWVNA